MTQIRLIDGTTILCNNDPIVIKNCIEDGAKVICIDEQVPINGWTVDSENKYLSKEIFIVTKHITIIS